MVSSFIRRRPKLPGSNLRVTSTNAGDTVSSAVKLPGSSVTTRIGSAATKTGTKDFSRITTNPTGESGSFGYSRETKSTRDVNNPIRVKQIAHNSGVIGSRPARTRTIRGYGGGSAVMRGGRGSNAILRGGRGGRAGNEAYTSKLPDLVKRISNKVAGIFS